MSDSNDFLKKLHEQTSEISAPKEKKDKAIMKVLGSWIVKRTPEYMKATDNGMSDAEYLGEKAKKACIDKDVAWESAEKMLKKWYDIGSVEEDMKDEFDKAYGVFESIVADFPEEAEAYWGLCLCKYGIEYVDGRIFW